jgi:ATP-binding protein involved in chromosome partitioning
VISIGMLKPRRDQVVAWRGPMLDRALVQMLSDVYWGDLDVLLLDLPPGTGDVAISLGQHLPNAEVVVVTTPQEAAAEVAERAGTITSMLHQHPRQVLEHARPGLPRGPEHDRGCSSGGGQCRGYVSRVWYDVPSWAVPRSRHEGVRQAGGRLHSPTGLGPGPGRRAGLWTREDEVWRDATSSSEPV